MGGNVSFNSQKELSRGGGIIFLEREITDVKMERRRPTW